MSKIQVFQVDCKVYLLKDISLNTLFSELSHYVDKVLTSNKDMISFHKAYRYKHYVLSGFKEVEADRTYKEGKVYTFSIRCIKEELCQFFVHNLGEGKTNSIKGLTATKKIIPKRFIERLYTLTPALIKLEEGGYWRGNLSFEQYERRIWDNSIKKYQDLTGEKIDEDFVFYHKVQFLNEKPISNRYTNKGITLLGDKLDFEIAENETAQSIAYMLLGSGLLEGNSRGYGFLNYKST